MKLSTIFTAVLATTSSFFVSADLTWKPSTDIDISEPGQGAFLPQVALDGQTGISVWHRSNGSKTVIQTAHTADGGATWSSVTNLSDPAQDAQDAQIAINGLKGIAVWRRANGFVDVVQTSHTTDGGVNWSSVTDLSDPDGLKSAVEPQIAMSGQRGIAVWTRQNGLPGGKWIIQASYTTDGGATWLAAANAKDLSADGQNSFFPQIAMSGQNGIAVWRRSNGFVDVVQTSHTTDGGVNWSSVTDLSDPDGLKSAVEPQIAMSGQRGIAVWTRQNGLPGGKWIIQASYTTDGGATWLAAVDAKNLSSDGQNAEKPQISLSGKNGIAVWKRSNGSNTIIQTSYTKDGGVTWSSVLDLSDVGGNADEPQIEIREQNGVSVWYRNDGTYNIIQSKNTTDGGKTWSSVTNLSATNTNSGDPRVAMSGRNVIAVWSGFESVFIIQTKYSMFAPLPPTFASGKKVGDRFAMQSAYYNLLTWQPSPSTEVSYVIYRDSSTTPLATVPGDTFSYKDQPVSKKSVHTYQIKSVDSWGQESTAYNVTVR